MTKVLLITKLTFTTNTLSFQLIKPPIISSLCAVCYIDCLVKELGINNNTDNPIYTPTSLSKEEILFKSVISSFGLSIKDDYVDLPSLDT